MKTYTIPKYGITVQVMTNNGKSAGVINSELKKHLIGDEDPSPIITGAVNEDELEAYIDAIESLLLGHACSGLDIGSEAYVTGLDTALEAIANNL
jgi:hypothetical protein